ncbi:apoptosis facilitator Bcl-2-like protein 14 isoform X1 [Opisthocomus hoazin]|uniref:apoptosis facilitator Bcl-2-like protein 14 isoform X1 n=1 Tax=Opisthocomus hoazin TaxID=30419 RepID=UPI003F52FCAE
MSSPNDVSMEEIQMEGDERDSIEYKILMAYARRRLSVSKYGKLLENEANVCKSSSLIRRKAETDHQRDKDGPSQRAVLQGGVVEQHSKKQAKRKHLPAYRLPLLCGRAEQGKLPTASLQQGRTADFFLEAQSLTIPEGNSQHRTRLARENKERAVKYTVFSETGHYGETADVNHIADKLAKLVASRSQESPSDVSFKVMLRSQGPCLQEDSGDATDGTEDDEKIIQTIVSLLRKSGDQLEEKIKKDRVFHQRFKDMLSYTFFKRITDLFLEDVSADSTRQPEGQVNCTKAAFTMEIATKLTAVDSHPMNLVMGFGSKYLREHFSPWIQHQGGWGNVLSSLDEEEVE